MMTARALIFSGAEEARVAELRRLSAQGAAALPRLLEHLAEPSWTVRREVVASIISLGAAATAPLCARLRDRRDNEASLAAIVDALVGLDADVLADVEALARASDPATVADAAQILGRRRSDRAVPLLKELVAHHDDNVAVAAIEAVGRIGGAAAVDSLLEAVASGTFFRVFPAIEVLGRSGDPRAVAPLAQLLADPMYATEAARALGHTGQLAAVAPLGAALASAVESVAGNAAVALARIAAMHRDVYGTDTAVDDAMRRSVDGARVVARLLRDRPPRRSVDLAVEAEAQEDLAAIVILGAIGGTDAIACLITLVSKPHVAGAAALALRKIGRAADGAVHDAVEKGTSVERAVLLPMAGLGSVAAMVLCTADSDGAVRALACDALARVGAASAVDVLFTLLADPRRHVQQAALTAIQALGTERTKTLALRDARSPNAVVRRLALRILGYYGSSDAMPVFAEALEDPDPRIREAGLLALALVDEPAALAALVAAAASPFEGTRAVALRALGHTGRKGDAQIAAVLRAALSDGDAWVRYYACQAIGRLALEDAVDDVTQLLRDDAGQVRVAAVEALSHLKTGAALKALRVACEGNDPDVQRAALLGLGATQMPEGLAVLMRAAGSTDAATRLVAISALAARGGPHALAAFADAARDDDENVRAAALGFLAACPGPESAAVLVDLLRTAMRAGIATEPFATALSHASVDRIDGILAALAWADDAFATVLVSCLARQRGEEAEAGLVRALAIDCVPARKAAASALGNLRTAAAMVALQSAASADLDPDVRSICHVLVGR